MPQVIVQNDKQAQQIVNMLRSQAAGEADFPEGFSQGDFVNGLETFKQAKKYQRVMENVDNTDTGVRHDEREAGFLETVGRAFAPPGTFQERDIGDAEAPTRALLHNEAAERGIDISTGMPAADTLRSDALAGDPMAKWGATEYLVRQRLKEGGHDIPDELPVIWEDEGTGENVYLRAQEDGSLKQTLVNPLGMGSEDLTIAIPEILRAGTETAGALAGGAAGGFVTKGGAGVGTGATVGSGVMGGFDYHYAP